MMKRQGIETFISLIVLLFLLLPSLFVITKGNLYPSHDGLFHVARIDQFHKSILYGQFPPRLAPTILNGQGYPLFIVNYQLPYYFAEIFMLFGNNPVFAFKSTMAVTYILGAVFAFFLFKQFASSLASLTGAIVFSYLPYRFANLYTRGSLGESVAMVFVPLFVLGLHLVKNKNRWALTVLALSTFGLITSHTIIFLLFLPFFVLYLIFQIKPKRRVLTQFLIGVFLGIISSSFQLLPAIFERKYLKFDQNLMDLFNGHFLNLYQLLRIPKEGVNIGTAFQLGITSIFILALCTVFLAKSKKTYLLFFAAVILGSIFLIHTRSVWLWRNMPFLNYILYPWRFLSLTVVSFAFLGVYLVDSVRYKKLLASAIIVLTIFTSRHYFLKSTQTDPQPPTESLTTQNEFDPIWTTQKSFSNTRLITTPGEISIINLSHAPFLVNFDAQTKDVTRVTINKLYFPGWQVEINNMKVQPFPQDGLISFDLPSGTSKVVLKFGETRIRKVANLVSLAALFTILLMAVNKVWSLNLSKIYRNRAS